VNATTHQEREQKQPLQTLNVNFTSLVFLNQEQSLEWRLRSKSAYSCFLKLYPFISIYETFVQTHSIWDPLLIFLVSKSQGERVQNWSYLRLPDNLAVFKDKSKPGISKSPPDPCSSRPKSTLSLECSAVCASDISKQATACFGCIQREVSPLFLFS